MASVGLGSTNTNQGLYQDEVNGALTQVAAPDGRQATGLSMYFAVDDSFALSCQAATPQVTVEYFDSGVTQIDVKYRDRTGIERTAGSIDVINSDTKKFKSKTMDMPNASFNNSLTGANDFRLDAIPVGKMVIKSVSLAVSRAETSLIPSLPSGWKRILLPLSLRNGTDC